jgi:hypothetical protein
VIPALLASLAVAAAAGATATTIDVLHDGRTQRARVKRETRVAVLLPAELPVAGRVKKLYVSGSGVRNSWTLEFAAAPRCGGADACLVASFEGHRGGRLPGRPNVRLAGGAPGLYRPVTCGASCAPATLWFLHGGTLYTWQVKDPPTRARPILARLAGMALAAGPR